METRLPWERYLELVEADGRRLAELARRDLTAGVPSCPGWTVRDLVEHVAQVYQHKIACTRLQRAPENWPPPVPDGDPVDWLDASRAELLELLAERGPEAPSATWWPDDQTVGFWYRRMAHETAVHRIDAELAFGEATPVDFELAVDGIDEMLRICLEGDWSDLSAEDWQGVSPEAGSGQTIEVRGRAHSWRVTLHPDRVDLEPGSGEAAAVVDGEPSDVDLWLWGRRGADAIEVSGDPAAVHAFHDRLRLAAQ